MKTFKLRPYQIDALNVIHEDLKTEPVVLFQAIMGAGMSWSGRWTILNGFFRWINLDNHIPIVIYSYLKEETNENLDMQTM